MTDTPSTTLVTFTSKTKSAFQQHMRENPNNRRVSQTDKETVVEWLKNPHKRPLSQKDFSRRHYVWKAFSWDEKTQGLLAVAKGDEEKGRAVVAEDMIADLVESVHEGNGHAGWDATWNNINTTYHGIPRSDVIYLLKQCQICAFKPSKRPKGAAATIPSSQSASHELGPPES